MEHINKNGNFISVNAGLDPREVGSLGVEAYFSIDICSATGSGSGNKDLLDEVRKANKQSEDAAKQRQAGTTQTSR